MGLVTTTDAVVVERLARAITTVDPVAYTVFGSIAAGVRDSGAAPFAVHPEGAPTALAARSHAHTGVVFTAGWDATGDLGEVGAVLGALDPPPAAVAGPPEVVRALGGHLPLPVTGTMEERLFRLDELIEPRPAAGSARLSTDADVGFLAAWFSDFVVEAFGRVPPGFDPYAMVERGTRSSRCWIWCDPAGRPESFAVGHPPVVGVSRIGPVYTPAEHRGHGYASCVTACTARDILDRGDVPCLYTDLRNPTSNRIYRAIGFRPVADRSTLRFT